MENIIDEAVCEWKKLNVQNIPLVIWGGRKLLGGTVAKWLDEQGIKYDAIAVNDDFLQEGDGNVSLEKYVDKHKCCLVVAFKGYREEMLDKLNKDNIVKVYACDFEGRLVIGEDSKITESMLEEHSEQLKQFRESIADEESLTALDRYIHQKMYSEYSKEYSHNRQYFDKDVIAFQKGEVFVDCGGFDGADTQEFLKVVNDDPEARAYIFEPDPMNCENIRKNLGDDSRINIYNMATGDEQEQLHFCSGQGEASKLSDEGEYIVEVNRLDDVLGDSNVTFLKMDIEGAELKTLHGAEKLIRRCRPKMAICIYHRAEDLWTIPQYILSLHGDYRFYVRSYHPSSEETVLYAL
jgi:FkbM family methyltransferase